MKKRLLSLALVMALGLAANAQTEGPVHKISVGPDFLYPFGSKANANEVAASYGAADSFTIGYGGSIMGEYNIAKKLNLTATAGFSMLAYKKEIKALYPDGLSNEVYFPIKLGAKYFFGPVYGAADAGMAVSFKSNRNSAFAFSGTVGKAFSVSSKSSVDVGIRYEGWSMYRDVVGITIIDNYSFAGIRVAYAFGL